MTPAYALTQLLKLGALSYSELLLITCWNEEKLQKAIIDSDVESNGIAFSVREMRDSQDSPASQRLPSHLLKLWGCGFKSTDAYVAEQRRKNAATAGLVSRLCEMGAQRIRAAAISEGITAV